MRVGIEVIDALSIERRRSTLDAMNDVVLLEQELGKICAVLSSYTGDKSYVGAIRLRILSITLPLGCKLNR